MGKAMKEVFDYIDDFLAGKVDPMEFSWDLQYLIAENLREIEKENLEVAERLNSEFPEVCDMYETGDPLKPFQNAIRKTYEYVKEAL